MDTTRLRNILAIPALTAALALSAAACGDDDTAASAGTPTTATPTTEHAEDHADTPGELTVSATDFAFGGVPEEVPAGTRLRLVNESPVELHELVAFRLADDETRGPEELLQMPPAEAMAILGAPRAVLLQAPGSTDVIEAVGDGTLGEPGRYILMCAIPTGADPAEYLAAAAASPGGPPQGVAGGPPHVMHGMYAELTVTG